MLFDINRAAKLGPLLRSAAETMLSRILADPPRNFRTTIITNAGPDTYEVVERVTEAGCGRPSRSGRSVWRFRPASSRCRTSPCRFR